MEKEQLLKEITQAATAQTITKEDVVKAFEVGRPTTSHALNKDVGISEVMYFIGGFIVFFGITILVWQNWNTLPTVTKILATLGFGILAYGIGILFQKEEKYGALGYAFNLIAALVLPLGFAVLLDTLGVDTATASSQSLISGVLAGLYLSSYFLFNKPIFTFFSIAYATWFFFAFTNMLIGTNPYFADIEFYEYRFFFVGITYLCLGYYFSFTEQKDLSGVLNGFGSLFTLGAALLLGGWKPEQNIFWEAIFPFLVTIMLYLSVKLKSKPFLTFGTIFLMIYILKITGEYFSGTIGWPLSLMLSGISLIGIGYYAFLLNKRYLTI